MNRDDDGYLLLNLNMLTASTGVARTRMEDNFWLSVGDPEDVECPPSGSKLNVRYEGGDLLNVEFFELDEAQLGKRYPDAHPERWDIELPITAAEIQMRVGGTEIEFGPRYSKLPGGSTITNGFIARCGVGIQIG